MYFQFQQYLKIILLFGKRQKAAEEGCCGKGLHKHNYQQWCHQNHSIISYLSEKGDVKLDFIKKTRFPENKKKKKINWLLKFKYF